MIFEIVHTPSTFINFLWCCGLKFLGFMSHVLVFLYMQEFPLWPQTSKTMIIMWLWPCKARKPPDSLGSSKFLTNHLGSYRIWNLVFNSLDQSIEKEICYSFLGGDWPWSSDEHCKPNKAEVLVFLSCIFRECGNSWTWAYILFVWAIEQYGITMKFLEVRSCCFGWVKHILDNKPGRTLERVWFLWGYWAWAHYDNYTLQYILICSWLANKRS